MIPMAGTPAWPCPRSTGRVPDAASSRLSKALIFCVFVDRDCRKFPLVILSGLPRRECSGARKPYLGVRTSLGQSGDRHRSMRDMVVRPRLSRLGSPWRILQSTPGTPTSTQPGSTISCPQLRPCGGSPSNALHFARQRGTHHENGISNRVSNLFQTGGVKCWRAGAATP
jgi:hypothetical protein